jgi:hypothetical protein
VSTHDRAHDAQETPYTLEPFAGGRRAVLRAAVAGVAGLALTALGGLSAPQEALISYLTAFVYWLGIALGSLVLTMAFNAAGARWMIVLRRAMETMHASLPAFAVLFLPILAFARQIFLWIEPPASLGKEGQKIVQAKHAYLNLGSFTVRAAIYFAIFLLVSWLLWTWSNRQDTATDATYSVALTRRQRALSAGGLPFVGLALTFASFDWLMSLNPLFFSTIFGIYYFAGAFLGAIAVLTIASAAVRHQPGTHGPFVSLAHYHNLGKLLLAFTAFWAYVTFSQYMLTWIANLPEELSWFVSRTAGPWKPIWVLLIVGHFLVPFFLLLSRDLKLRPRALSVLAGWLLVACFIDTWWVVVPTFHPHGIFFHWTQVTALVGVGGIAVSVALARARGRFTVPVGDPYLPDSLRYTQP